MARHPESNEGPITLQKFVSLLKTDKLDAVLQLGQREVLDYLMEALEYRDRGTVPTHAAFGFYLQFKRAFKEDPFSPEWVTAAVSLLENITFTPAQIRDAFGWYFSAEHTEAMTHPEDEGNMNDLQEVIDEAFQLRKWASPFHSLQ